jgi:hypothetical protein
MADPRILILAKESVNFTLFNVKWIPCSSRLVVLGSHPRGTGIWQVYNMSKGKLELLDEVFKTTIHSLIILPLCSYFLYRLPSHMP